MLDNTDRQWKLEVRAKYEDEHPYRLVLRNDFGSQPCLSLGPEQQLTLENHEFTLPENEWEILYANAEAHKNKYVDPLMFSLRSASISIKGDWWPCFGL